MAGDVSFPASNIKYDSLVLPGELTTPVTSTSQNQSC